MDESKTRRSRRNDLHARSKRCLQVAQHVAVVVFTVPYYRFFQLNTLGVIQQVAKYSSEPQSFPQLLRVLTRWRHRKLAELHYISIACAILVGATIGTFSWNTISSAFWLAPACWYISLILAILGILLSAQQVAVLNFLGELPLEQEGEDLESPSARKVVDAYLPLLVSTRPMSKETLRKDVLTTGGKQYEPGLTMVFTWQCPIMFMSYSVCLFLLGLTMLVVTPLMRVRESGWTGDATVAVIYLITATIAVATFLACAFWLYHYVDLEETDASPHHRTMSLASRPMTTRPGRGEGGGGGNGQGLVASIGLASPI